MNRRTDRPNSVVPRGTMLRVAALTAAAFVVLAACVDPFSPGRSGDNAAAEENGSLAVQIGGVAAQSIIPEVSSLVNHYRVTLSRTGYTDVVEQGTTNPGVSETVTVSNLDEGTWNVLVEAVDTNPDPDAVVGTGTGVASVTDGSTASVSVAVAPTTAGSGALDLALSWPAGEISGINGATLGGTDISASFSLTGSPSDGAVYSETGISSGSHLLTILLEQDDGSGPVVVATLVEAVHIYDSVTTSGTITLTSADIAQPPSAPTGVSAVAINPNQVDVSWTDASTTETGFEVERSEDGGSSWASVASLPAGAQNHSDTTAQAGTEYTYRVVAVNDFGSTPAGTATVSTPTPSWSYVGAYGFANVSSSSNTDVIVLDEAGSEVAYAAYMDLSDNGAYVVRNDGGSWTPVGGASVTTVQYSYRPIRIAAYRSSGTTHLYAAVATGLDSVGVYHWNGTSWSLLGDEVSGNMIDNLDLDLAVGTSSATPYLSVLDDEDSADSDGDVSVYTFNGTSWVLVGSSALTTTEDVYVWAGVAIEAFDDGASDEVYVAYLQGSTAGSRQPMVRRWNGTSWSNVGPALPSDFDYGIAFDVYDDGATRTPYVASYRSSQHFSVNYYSGGSWTEITSASDLGQVVDLEIFDNDGTAELYVMYYYNNKGLIVRWDGSAFVSPGSSFASRDPANSTSDIGKQNAPRLAIYSDSGYANLYVSAADWSVNSYSSGKGITVRQFE